MYYSMSLDFLLPMTTFILLAFNKHTKKKEFMECVFLFLFFLTGEWVEGESPLEWCLLRCWSGQVKDQTTTAIDWKILKISVMSIKCCKIICLSMYIRECWQCSAVGDLPRERHRWRWNLQSPTDACNSPERPVKILNVNRWKMLVCFYIQCHSQLPYQRKCYDVVGMVW